MPSSAGKALPGRRSGGHPSGCQPEPEGQQDKCRRRSRRLHRRSGVAVVRVADASHRAPGPARFRQATLVRRVLRSAVAPDVLEVTVQVVLREELAPVGTLVGKVLLRIEVGVRAVVCSVRLVPRRPAAYVALHSVPCREQQGERKERQCRGQRRSLAHPEAERCLVRSGKVRA